MAQQTILSDQTSDTETDAFSFTGPATFWIRGLAETGDKAGIMVAPADVEALYRDAAPVPLTCKNGEITVTYQGDYKVIGYVRDAVADTNVTIIGAQ